MHLWLKEPSCLFLRQNLCQSAPFSDQTKYATGDPCLSRVVFVDIVHPHQSYTDRPSSPHRQDTYLLTDIIDAM